MRPYAKLYKVFLQESNSNRKKYSYLDTQTVIIIIGYS